MSMKKGLVAIMAIGLLLRVLIVSSWAKNSSPKEKSKPATNPADVFAQKRPPTQGQEPRVTPVASKPVGFAVSAPLREMSDPRSQRNTSIFASGQEDVREANEQNTFSPRQAVGAPQPDPAIQTNVRQQRGLSAPALAMPTPNGTFEGLSSQDNLTASRGSTVMPPDTNGDVGPNHYVETTNFLFQVYTKAGAPSWRVEVFINSCSDLSVAFARNEATAIRWCSTIKWPTAG